ncbi:hypothetical protein [Pseudoalteromonas sp. S16_S37]|uniref:hypothetical protein n=1 Tax=Pseudoalteromonas sp. S16_S37 TaxID=2720228 RepID=UPI001680C7C7|nr:hypothetical protein [Pseudoalteromonas sp. S16_S37]MBD1584848.1 hypothetical protein [Pseudoalteromonas sp. S16_S37]
MKKLKHKKLTFQPLDQGIAKVVAAGNGSGNDPITQARAQSVAYHSDNYIIKVSNP